MYKSVSEVHILDKYQQIAVLLDAIRMAMTGAFRPQFLTADANGSKKPSFQNNDYRSNDGSSVMVYFARFD